MLTSLEGQPVKTYMPEINAWSVYNRIRVIGFTEGLTNWHYSIME